MNVWEPIEKEEEEDYSDWRALLLGTIQDVLVCVGVTAVILAVIL